VVVQCECVSGGSVDVNLLLTQLLAKGLIGQTDASQSSTPPPAAETSSAVAEVTAASDVSDVCMHPFFKPPPPVGAGGGYMFSGRPCVRP